MDDPAPPFPAAPPRAAAIGNNPDRTRGHYIHANDTALGAFLSTENERDADRCLDRLQREFITPAIRAELARELHRSPAVSDARLHEETEAFRELEVIVAGRIAQRLRAVRASAWEEAAAGAGVPPVRYFLAYVQTAVSNAVTDYLRQKRPGRRALDLALRTAFAASADLAIWRIQRDPDYVEWRCGCVPWKEAPAVPVRFLRSDPALQAQLRQHLSGTEPKKTLQQIFDTTGAPLLYDDVVTFLSAYWAVEEPYRASVRAYSSLRAPSLSASVEEQPERVATRIGTLQEIWEAVRRLSPLQAASLLLRLPSTEEGSFLDEFIRLKIASQTEIAQAVGLSTDDLFALQARLPLSDREIAPLIGVPFDAVRRIRQDAQRRLERMQTERKKT